LCYNVIGGEEKIERHHKPKECPIAFKKVAVNAPNSQILQTPGYITRA